MVGDYRNPYVGDQADSLELSHEGSDLMERLDGLPLKEQVKWFYWVETLPSD